MAHVYDFATPTGPGVYVVFPIWATIATGLGAALIASGQGFDPMAVTQTGLGWAFISSVNSAALSLYLRSHEKDSFFQLRAELEANRYPDLNEYANDVEAIEEPEPVKPGMMTFAVKDEDTGTGADLYTPTVGFWRLARYGGADPKKAMSEDEWTGAGKPFSLDEFRKLRDWMIDERKLALWNNERSHNQGWKITSRARALLRGLERIERYTPPLLKGV